MLEQARSKGVYDHLHQQDIIDYLQQREQDIQVLVAADTLVYFGDLSALIQVVEKRLASDGFFITTVEKRTGQGYRLHHTGRYQHSLGYLHQLAVESGLLLSRKGTVELRRGSGDWVAGLLLVICRAEMKPVD